MQLELRMYGFVPYNISEIQKGIQFGHGAVEYSIKHFQDDSFLEWAKTWKTFIILNGGTSNNIHGTTTPTGEPYVGSMEQIHYAFDEMQIDHSIFKEPDLNNMLSSINFIVDERVFNKTKYPNFVFTKPENRRKSNELRQALRTLTPDQKFLRWKDQIIKPILGDEYSDFGKWIESIGGDTNFYLRCFLSNYHFA